MSEPNETDRLDESDAWLWDRTREPDADVVRLEALLSPLGHRTGTPPPQVHASTPRRSMPWAVAAGLLVAAGAAFAVLSSRRSDETTRDVAAVRVVVDGVEVAAGEWIEARDASRSVRFGDVGDVTLDAGSRLRLAHAAKDRTQFFLERGRLEARVSATARPRFFQVETPAVRCVDLGCRYTLDVDAAGGTRVHVLTGQVAFEVPGREVWVPAGAVCIAKRGSGPGTPRFEDAPSVLVDALDAYDAAAADSPERAALAKSFLAHVQAGRDALPAWHLLSDPDEEVERAAVVALSTRFGTPSGWTARAARLSPSDRQAWRDHLEEHW